MKRIIFACLLTISAWAQKTDRYQEIGLFLGGSYYLGDLNVAKHFNMIEPAGGIVYRYNFNQRYNIKANVLFGTVKGADSESGVPSQISRNLAFKSPITEVAAEFEFNFLEYAIGNRKTLFTPYVFAGVNYFRMRPQAQVGETWYDLQPLGTEGQGTSENSSKKYKLNQVAVPFGVGLKFNIANNIGFSCEWGLRKTFTDYIDDVSKSYVNPSALSTQGAFFADQSIGTDPATNVGKQRGDSSTKDWYSFAGVMLTFKLRGKPNKCNGYN
jgi:hypothetical protein